MIIVAPDEFEPLYCRSISKIPSFAWFAILYMWQTWMVSIFAQIYLFHFPFSYLFLGKLSEKFPKHRKKIGLILVYIIISFGLRKISILIYISIYIYIYIYINKFSKLPIKAKFINPTPLVFKNKCVTWITFYFENLSFHFTSKTMPNDKPYICTSSISYSFNTRGEGQSVWPLVFSHIVWVWFFIWTHLANMLECKLPEIVVSSGRTQFQTQVHKSKVICEIK